MSKFNPLFYILAIIIILYLSLFSHLKFPTHFPTDKDFQKDPLRFLNQEIELCGTPGKLSNNQIEMNLGDTIIPIKIQNPRLPNFGTFCILGTYDLMGHINATYIRYDDYLFVKYILSALSILYIIYIFKKEWKLNKFQLEVK